MIINYTMQSNLKENEPSVPIPKIGPEPGRALLKADREVKLLSTEEGVKDNNKKRENTGITDCASLNGYFQASEEWQYECS